MQLFRVAVVLRVASLTGVECSTLLGERVADYDLDLHHRPGLLGNVPSAHSSNLRLQLQDQIKQEIAKLSKMREQGARKEEVVQEKPAWMAPPNPHEDRLNDDHCKEPKPYVKTDYAGAFGPDKIYCCRTVRQVIQDVKYRCEVECNDAHPCHASMKETYCPKYLAAYRKMEAVLCKARPTTSTTITTTTTTTTIPQCVDAPDHSPSYPCRCGANNNLCKNNEICDHSDGSCTHELPLCPVGTVCQNYPCQCGPFGLKKTCNSTADGDEVCTDWETGKCEILKPADSLEWCYTICEENMKEHMILAGPGVSVECGECVKEAQDAAQARVGPGCKAFCQNAHKKGALRPEDEHARHAVVG